MTGWLVLIGIAVGVPLVLFVYALCVIAGRADDRADDLARDTYSLDDLGKREGGAAFPSPVSPSRVPGRGVSSPETPSAPPPTEGPTHPSAPALEP